MSELVLRYMQVKDSPEVLAIEHDSFAEPWSDDDFRQFLRERNCIGMVAVLDGQVVGYVVYRLMPRYIHLLNLAVRHEHRRRGIGRAFIDKLKVRARAGRRSCLALEVAEWNLRAQVFFRACGLRASTILRSHYHDGSDAFQFCWYSYAKVSV